MYVLPEPISHHEPENPMALSLLDTTELCHRRLAHINSIDLPTLHRHPEGVPKLGKMTDVCRARRLGKLRKLPFPGKFK